MPRDPLGHGTEGSSVKPGEADAPIDHAAVRKTTSESLYETGVADKGTQPVVEKVQQSGTDPNVEYQYFRGSDGRIYGKGQKLPEGVTYDGFVRIIVENLGAEYYARVIVTKDVDGNLEETAYTNSSMGDAIPLDPGDPNSAPKSPKGRDREKYATKDPKLAVRQALVDAQGNGILHDPVADLHPKPGPKVPAAALIAAAVVMLGVTGWMMGGKKAASPAAPAPVPTPSPAAPQATKNADGSFSLGDKKYYVVYGNDKAKDTGDEVCAAAGKTCVGYTDLTVGVCLAAHPGAQVTSDYDGSKAGFYCNGAPQGGVCAKEANTCHICPACNLNMDCAMEVGVLYNETYVECK